MPNTTVEQGIAAIQAGNIEEGGRLLKIALNQPDLTGPVRAVACLWLAEISPDTASKRTYYTAALDADPGNAQIRSRVEAWMAAQPQPTPPRQPTTNPGEEMPPLPPELPGTGSTFHIQPAPPGGTVPQTSPFAPQPPNTLPRSAPVSPVIQPAPSGGADHIVMVLGGPNGPGTAFFVAREGLLATTRYVVGGADQLTVRLETGREIQGYVVRAFPGVDLAFIYVEYTVNDLIPTTPLPNVPDNAPLMLVSSNTQILQGTRRATKRKISPGWFPTDIVVTTLPDAGGCPILDEQRYLVGMATRDTSSTSSYIYGLHINTIRQYADRFRQETAGGNRLYCPHCGYYSQAPANGGYYCEVCGAVTPQAERITRFRQPQTEQFYREQSQMKCRHCNASVGFYKGMCLRCGRPATG